MLRWSVADVMTTPVVAVEPATGYRRIADLLVAHRISAVPVLAPDGSVLGIVSEADLLEKLAFPDARPHHPLVERALGPSPRTRTGDTAAALMSSPAVTIEAAAPVPTAARLMAAARVKRLPVVDRDGKLVGIVSRHDVLKLFARPDEEILDSVRQAVSALGLRPEQVQAEVTGGRVLLSGPVADEGIARTVTAVVASIPGVVNVRDQFSRAGRLAGQA
jgi:CBS domain-containing protein